ncbi:MAG: tetratricopeptide repeat protein [Cucumibacter sp.]
MPIFDGRFGLRRLAAAALLAAAPGWALAQEHGAVDAAPANAAGAGSFAFALAYEGGVTTEQLVAALEEAAEAGLPLALWRLGVMYENGDGVEPDQAKAFLYFSRIANDNAETPPRSLEADVVAQSFLKVGQYYRTGLPDAGIPVDVVRARALLLHAATYFGDAEAQYQVGLLYLAADEFGRNPIQSVRWFRLAAQKGHPGAQAKLGELLFKGEGFEPEPVEGLMWLMLAARGATGTADEEWIKALAEDALSVASTEDRDRASHNADMLGPQIDG